jgi:hypothetical protein
VLGALPSIQEADAVPVAHASRTIHLPFKPYPPPAKTALALSEAQSALDTLERVSAAVDQVGPAKTRRLTRPSGIFMPARRRRALTAVCQSRSRDFASARRSSQPSPANRSSRSRFDQGELDHPVFIMGITNGYVGYLPNPRRCAGGYEVVSAKVTEAAEIFSWTRSAS